MVALLNNQNAPGPVEFLRSLQGANFHKEARDRGLTVAQLLEEEFPEPAYEDGLTPLARLMAAGDLIPRSDLATGFFASTMGDFDKNHGTRFVLHEYLRQVWDNAVNCRPVSPEFILGGQDGERAAAGVLTSFDGAYGTAFQPWVVEAQARYTQIAPQIPLAALIAITTPIAGGAYEAFYLQDQPTAQRMVRVAQGAELPRAKLVGTNHIIQLHKYGRAIEITYELLRRQRIDLVALQVARIAIQAESDRVSAAINVAVNGDGNANTAATSYNLTALDPAATAGTLTVKGWLSFKLKFPNPYMMTTALANETAILQLETLNLGSANIPLAYVQSTNSLGSFNLINPQLRDAVAIGVSSQAPANTIVALDARLALQRVTEVGGELTETERFITRQTQALAMSYVDGYATLDQFAVRVLNVNA